VIRWRSLEVIGAHGSISPIAMQTFDTAIGEVLAGIIVLALPFAEMRVSFSG
jgi:hypothetical protein